MKGIFAYAVLVWMSHPWAAPRIPFSGALGATAGAGAAVGWEKFGLGVNPAVGEFRALGFALATYAPFGMEDLRIAEAGAAWGGSRWAAAFNYRGWEKHSEFSSAWEFRESLRLGRGLSAGLMAEFLGENGANGRWGAGLGMLWKIHPLLTLGGFAAGTSEGGGDGLNAGAGADAGWAFRNGTGFRLCAEGVGGNRRPWELRLGASLRLHALLSVQGGYNPAAETVGLGIRFGMGRWEGFHALRRHSSLGSTSLQGLRWRRPGDPILQAVTET